MSAGRWVFPTTIVLFLALVVGVNLSTPAQPVLRSQAGDVVVVEYTAYYDETNGYVWYTTEEELYQEGRLKRGPFPIGFRSEPAELGLDPSLVADDRTLASQLLGRRLNETFTTPKFRGLYGQLQETKDVPLVVGEYDRTVSYRNGQNTPDGPFNYSMFVRQWATYLRHEVRVGDVFPCEGAMPWECEITALDPAQGRLTYRRLAEPGRTVRAQDLVLFTAGTIPPTSNLTVVERTNERFALRWDVRRGDAFVLEEPLGEWTPGTYRVDSVDGSRARVRYAPTRDIPVPAHVLGETVWFTFRIVAIERGAALPP